MTISRRVLDSALPRGPIWQVAPGEDLDKFYDAVAENYEVYREQAEAIADLRNPEKTSVLSDLELEFGVLPNEALTEAQRRAYVAGVIGDRGATCSAEWLESKLNDMGFDVRVYPNDPPIDPYPVLLAAGADASLVVNGDVVSEQQKYYDMTCEAESASTYTATCEDEEAETFEATCDSFFAMRRVLYEYEFSRKMDGTSGVTIPESRWRFVFFIADSIAGNERFPDWNMERSTCGAWTEGDSASISKSLELKVEGIRSLLVTATETPDPDETYAENRLESSATGSREVSVTCWCLGNRRAGLMICDSDGVWDESGIVLSSDSANEETLTYTASNGVSAVRLFVCDGSSHGQDVVEGDWAAFDNLRCEGLTVVPALIPEARSSAFRKAVLKYKPLRTWCVACVDHVASIELEEDDADMSSVTKVTTTSSGTLSVGSSYAYLHVILAGTASGYTVTFDDATTFTSGFAIFRFTNQSTKNVAFKDHGGNTLATLLPNTRADFVLADISTENGDWTSYELPSGIFSEV